MSWRQCRVEAELYDVRRATVQIDMKHIIRATIQSNRSRWTPVLSLLCVYGRQPKNILSSFAITENYRQFGAASRWNVELFWVGWGFIFGLCFFVWDSFSSFLIDSETFFQPLFSSTSYQENLMTLSMWKPTFSLYIGRKGIKNEAWKRARWLFAFFFAFCRLIPSQFKSTYGCFREGQEVLITPTRFLTRNQACLREFLEVQLFNLLIFDQSLRNLSRINVIHTRLTIFLFSSSSHLLKFAICTFRPIGNEWPKQLEELKHVFMLSTRYLRRPEWD